MAGLDIQDGGMDMLFSHLNICIGLCNTWKLLCNICALTVLVNGFYRIERTFLGMMPQFWSLKHFINILSFFQDSVKGVFICRNYFDNSWLDVICWSYYCPD